MWAVIGAAFGEPTAALAANVLGGSGSMSGFLAHRYRHGDAGYLRRSLFVAAGALVFVLTPITVAVTGRYEGLTLAQWAITLAIGASLAFVGVVFGALVNRRQLRLINAWIKDPSPVGVTPELLEAAQHLPRRLMVSVGLFAGLTAGPGGTIATLVQIHRLRVADLVLLTVGGVFFALWGIVAIWLWLELTMRPVLADLSRFVPAKDVRATVGLPVSGKLSIALATTLLVGSCYAGSLSATPGSAFTGLWRLVAITLGVSLVFAALLVPLYAELLVAPIRELIGATRSVSGGDLTTRLPVVGRDELGELTYRFNDMLGGLSERAELFAQNSKLVEELTASLGRIVSAGDIARRKVERDLHDGAQQRLVVAHLKVVRLHRQLAERDDELVALVHEVDVALTDALREFRELAHGVYPAQLEDGGLPSALQYLVSEGVVPTEVSCELDGRLRPEIESAIYFCCVEAIQNVGKHAGPAARGYVRIWPEHDEVCFEVSDDGLGFTPQTGLPGGGLQNLTDRVGALGGALTVTSELGAGTRVSGRIPHAAIPGDS